MLCFVAGGAERNQTLESLIFVLVIIVPDLMTLNRPLRTFTCTDLTFVSCLLVRGFAQLIPLGFGEVRIGA